MNEVMKIIQEFLMMKIKQGTVTPYEADGLMMHINQAMKPEEGQDGQDK